MRDHRQALITVTNRVLETNGARVLRCDQLAGCCNVLPHVSSALRGRIRSRSIHYKPAQLDQVAFCLNCGGAFEIRPDVIVVSRTSLHLALAPTCLRHHFHLHVATFTADISFDQSEVLNVITKQTIHA